jgi:Bacterial shufflon protein, N-terminal constant region.
MGQLIAVVISILISMISLAGFAKLSAIGVDNVKAAAVASQMVIVDTAFHQYISDNSATIAGIATPTTPVTLSIPTLVCAQYLPTSYAAGASCPAVGLGGGITNAYRQSYYAQVLQPMPGQLQSIVFTSGGTAISRKQIVSIAALVGAQGGSFLMRTRVVIPRCPHRMRTGFLVGGFSR